MKDLKNFVAMSILTLLATAFMPAHAEAVEAVILDYTDTDVVICSKPDAIGNTACVQVPISLFRKCVFSASNGMFMCPEDQGA